MKKAIVVIMALIALLISTAGAEEKFGVKVYPGAKYSDAETKWRKDQYHSETVASYRTADGSDKVSGFYKTHAGIKGGKLLGKVTYFHVTDAAKQETVEIQVMPSLDPATGQEVKGSTTILIVKRQMYKGID
jgi:hypothetical protein